MSGMTVSIKEQGIAALQRKLSTLEQFRKLPDGTLFLSKDRDEDVVKPVLRMRLDANTYVRLPTKDESTQRFSIHESASIITARTFHYVLIPITHMEVTCGAPLD